MRWTNQRCGGQGGEERQTMQQDLLHRPIQLLYPLEVCRPNPPDATTGPEISSRDTSPPEPAKEEEKTEVVHFKEAGKRSQCVTAQQADDGRKACMYQLQDI